MTKIKSEIDSDVILQGSGIDRFIRLVESTGAFNGGFIQMEGSTNKFHFGVHDANDNDKSSDQKVITLLRSNGRVGINQENPTVEFEVVGSLKVDGALLAPTFTNITNRLAIKNPSFGSSRLGDGDLQTPSLDVEVINFMGENQISNFAIFENNNVMTVRRGGGDHVGGFDFNGGNQAEFGVDDAEATFAATINFDNGFGYVNDVGVQRYEPGVSVVAKSFYDVMINSNGAPRMPHIKTYYDGTTYDVIRTIAEDGIMTHNYAVRGIDGVDPQDFVTKSQLDAINTIGGFKFSSVNNVVTIGGSNNIGMDVTLPANTLENDGDSLEFFAFFDTNGVDVSNIQVGCNLGFSVASAFNFEQSTQSSNIFASGKVTRLNPTLVIISINCSIESNVGWSELNVTNSTVNNLSTQTNQFRILFSDISSSGLLEFQSGFVKKM